MSVKESIKDFYNAQAEKFSWTRKKQWPEFEYVVSELHWIIKEKGKVKILELWCGDWRLYRYLVSYFWEDKIEYTWVDISEWLIEIAKEKVMDNWSRDLTNKNELSENSLTNSQISSFVVSDMLSFLEKQEQESYDFVIAVASFQHIPTSWERLLILKNIYRILRYNWKVMMFNWSFSKWFFKKYWKWILKSFLIWILSLWTRPINDVYIPWKDKDKTYYRYYHIFFLFEIKKLFKQAGFVIKEACYINKRWEKSISYQDSRNSCLIWEKKVLN